MTAGSALVAFADSESQLWGVLSSAETPLVAVGRLEDDGTPAVHAAELPDRSLASPWTIRWEGGELELAPSQADVTTLPHDGVPQLCTIHGHAIVDGDERHIQSHAVRNARVAGSLQTVRLVGGWFADTHGIGLLCSREPRSAGHQNDAVGVALAGEPGTLSVFDPRLSTTYEADGTLRRLGVELWLGASEDADLESRRFTASRLGEAALLLGSGLTVTAHALSWTGTRGAGIGVHLLALAA